MLNVDEKAQGIEKLKQLIANFVDCRAPDRRWMSNNEHGDRCGRRRNPVLRMYAPRRPSILGDPLAADHREASQATWPKHGRG